MNVPIINLIKCGYGKLLEKNSSLVPMKFELFYKVTIKIFHLYIWSFKVIYIIYNTYAHLKSLLIFSRLKFIESEVNILRENGQNFVRIDPKYQNSDLKLKHKR